MRVGENLEAVVARALGFTDPLTGARRTLPAGTYIAVQPGSGDPGHGGGQTYILQSLSDPEGQFLVSAARIAAWQQSGEIELRPEEI